MRKKEVLAAAKDLDDKFDLYQHVPGTGDNYSFMPLCDSHLQEKHVSDYGSCFIAKPKKSAGICNLESP